MPSDSYAYGSPGYRDPVSALAQRRAANKAKKKRSPALDAAAKEAGAAAGTLSARNAPAYAKRVQYIDEDFAMVARQLARKPR